MTIKQCLKLTLTSALSLALGIVLLSIVFKGWDTIAFFPKEDSHLKVIVSQLSYCESRNNPDAIHYNDGRAGLHSVGVLQFQLPTFYGQWKRLVNPNIDLADAANLWRDSASQRYLAEQMLAEDISSLRNWYNCSKKLGLL